MDLPTHIMIGDQEVIVDDLKPYELREAYKLVRREVEEGQDMGVDEFASEEHFRAHLKCSNTYGVFQSEGIKGLLAVIIITPSKFCRMPQPLLADGIIICDTKMKQKAMEHLIDLTSSLTMDLNYEGILFDVYRTSPVVFQMRSRGCLLTACIFDSGKLKDKGWMDSFIMYKDLPQNTSKGKERPKEELAKHTYMIKKARLTSLPEIMKTTSGKDIIVRYMLDHEVLTIYNMYKEAAKMGHGYSKDEFETLEYFQYYVIDHSHVFVFEDLETGRILGSLSILPNEYCRSVDPLYCDAYIVIDPSVRKHGVGTMGTLACIKIGRELGYKGLVGDAFISNYKILRLDRKVGYIICGFVPKSAIGKNGRIEDAVILYRSYAEDPKLESKL